MTGLAEMHRSLIGTSWKMNLTATEAVRYCEALLPLVQDDSERDLFVLPPFTSIPAVRDVLNGSQIRWGAQDVHPDDWGAHTGDVSAPMLADLGCSLVEVGHSERRRAYGESDGYVASQVAAIQRWGMTALVCVGEGERGSLDSAMAVIGPQLDALADADATHLVIAYEPVWAIGVGSHPAEPAWIDSIHAAIQDRLVSLHPGARVPVLYGGSVDSHVAPVILSRPGVGGLFVGRSALDPREFARIASS